MSDQAFRNAPPSENVEDRRNEFDEIQHLLMQIGAWQPQHPDQAYREMMGMSEPGKWMDYDLANGVVPPLSPMGAELGGADLDLQNEFARLVQTSGRGR